MRSGAVWPVLGLIALGVSVGCSSGNDATDEQGGGGFAGGASNAGGSSTGGTMQAGGSSGQAGAPGGSGGAGNAGSAGSATNATLTVLGDLNQLSLAACAATPASTDLGPGVYTARLEASSLSKGQVDNAAKDPSSDNYALIHLPESSPANADQRFFMLNGVGDQRQFKLEEPGTLQALFIDSDTLANHGSATIRLLPDDLALTVDATANVIGWREPCQAEPARVWVEAGQHELRLAESTLSSGGLEGNYVLLRLPSETPVDDSRYIILNGVGATRHFDAQEAGWIRGWFINSGGMGTGQGVVVVTPP